MLKRSSIRVTQNSHEINIEHGAKQNVKQVEFLCRLMCRTQLVKCDRIVMVHRRLPCATSIYQRTLSRGNSLADELTKFLIPKPPTHDPSILHEAQSMPGNASKLGLPHVRICIKLAICIHRTRFLFRPGVMSKCSLPRGTQAARVYTPITFGPRPMSVPCSLGVQSRKNNHITTEYTSAEAEPAGTMKNTTMFKSMLC